MTERKPARRGDPTEKQFLVERLIDDFEEGQAKSDILDFTIRRAAEEIMAHPEYRDMSQRVLKNGHRVRMDMDLSSVPGERFQILKIHTYDGGPAAPSDD